MKTTHPRLFPIVLLLSLVTGVALAEKPSDEHALKGLASGKIAWDINMGSAYKLKGYLKVMAETYDDLKRQGVEPDMIFTFRGPSVRLITEDLAGIPMDEEADHEEIAEQVRALLARPNVRMEACSIATRLAGIDGQTLLPGIALVGNTFVSQIGYQAKGYASIPIM